ncbi:hypothetical protein R3W88_007837 [Solanum pinnatisectum]|uniref:Uncharacterized protein n=1 Tax=Solanum pinnatisectum TaxID=50273 RepID=A0AAV9M6Z0_9SOLN|nr:hypothetical protein R3W88_007837 [Solanum pinnatisectum]
MVRERKKKEAIKLVVTPERRENTDLGITQGKNVYQGKEAMEQWPPLPTREITITSQHTLWGLTTKME